MRGLAVQVLCALVGACNPTEQAKAPSRLGDPGAPPPGREARSTVSGAAGAVRVEPFVPPAPAVAIVEPAANASIPADSAAQKNVVLDDSGYLAVTPGARIMVLLDAQLGRAVTEPGAPLALGDLVLDGAALAAGEHLLAAVVVGARGEVVRQGGAPAVACRRFWVGPAGAPSRPDEPALLVVSPAGTYNGPSAASALIVDYVVVGDSAGTGRFGVAFSVTGTGVTGKGTLGAAGPFALRGIGSGDYRVQLSLLDAGVGAGGRWTRTDRTITVNLDAPAGGGAGRR